MSFVRTSAARARAVPLLCLLLLFSTARVSAQQAAALPAEKVKQIEALVAAEMARQKIPGMSVAVVTDRQVLMRMFAALTLLLTAVFAGDLNVSAQRSPARPKAAAVEELLIANERLTWALYQKKDLKGLAALTSEDYYDIYPAGEVVDKKQYLQDVLETDVKEYSLSDFKVIMLNDAAAVVVYQAKVHGVVGGREIKSQVAVTSGWARRGGKWLNVFYRENAIELNGKRLL